jgi:hypothetical protein
MILKLTQFLIEIARHQKLHQYLNIIRDLLFGYILWFTSLIIPPFGWHRIWLKIGGWWLYAILEAIAVFGLIYKLPYLFIPYGVLVSVDALTLWVLILEKHKGARP